jgi:hypothetical protein
MSWQACKWARDQRAGSVAAKAILLVLAEQVNVGDACFLSVATIAERAELKRSAVLKHLAALDALGLISRSRRADQHGHRTTDQISLRRPAAQGPQDEPREAANVHEMDQGGAAKVHETGRLGPRNGPHREVSEKKTYRSSTPAPLPQGFPDDEAVLTEQAWLRLNGWNIDARHEAEKFRAHALAHGRRLKDWCAGLHQWVLKATELAPRSARHAEPETFAPGSPWERRVIEFRANGYWNSTDWGPKPGKPDCAVETAILAKFGFVENVTPLSREAVA